MAAVNSYGDEAAVSQDPSTQLVRGIRRIPGSAPNIPPIPVGQATEITPDRIVLGANGAPAQPAQINPTPTMRTAGAYGPQAPSGSPGAPFGPPKPAGYAANPLPSPSGTPPLQSSPGFLRRAAGVVNSAVDAAAPTLRSIGPALAAGAGGYGIAKLAQNATGVNTPGVTAPDPNAGTYTPNGAGAIPKSPEEIAAAQAGGVPLPVEPQPLGIGGDNNFTRTAANVLNSIAPVAGLPVAVRAGSQVARLLGGIRTAGAGIAGAEAANPALSGNSDATTGGPTPPSGSQPAYGGTGAPGAGAGSDTVLAPTPEPRDTISDLGGAGVDPAARVDALNAQAAGIRANTDRALQIEQFNNGTPGLRGIRDSATDERNARLPGDRAQYLAEQAIRLGGKAGPAQAAAITNAFKASADNGSNERIARLREMGENTRAIALNRLNAETARLHDSTAQRGQDLGLQEHYLSAQTARLQGQREQFNANRNYDAGRSDAAFTQNNAATAAHQTRLENTFRTTDENGKDVPDMGKIGAYNAAVDSTVPQLAQQLRSTGRPQDAEKAAELEKKGQAALTPSDHDQLTQLFKTREQLRAARGARFGAAALPGGAEFNDSNNLLNYKQGAGDSGIEHRVLSPNRIRFVGGSSATPNDLTVQGGANAILPDWMKTRTDDLIRGIRRPE